MFSYNSKFNQIVNQIIDCLFLSLIWFVSSLPILTLGASTTALYHTVDTVFRKEEGSVWKEYWRVFRRDFWRGTGLWLIMVAIIVVLATNFYGAFYMGVKNEMLQIVLQIGSVFLIALAIVWLQCWFPYLSRFDDPVKIILKNTLAMMMVETKVALRLLGLFLLVAVVDVVLSLNAPILVLVMPVAYTSAWNRIMEPMFARYLAQQNESAQTSDEKIENA